MREELTIAVKSAVIGKGIFYIGWLVVDVERFEEVLLLLIEEGGTIILLSIVP